jgi:hypothetical protein
MKIHKWYSAIIVSIRVIGCLISGITQASSYPESAATDLWAVVLYIPVAIYTWILVKRKE